jgi:yeast amino acid transporter
MYLRAHSPLADPKCYGRIREDIRRRGPGYSSRGHVLVRAHVRYHCRVILTGIRYTYCVTFSALIISAADLTDYWGLNPIFKALIYVLVPIGLMIINAFPVVVFGWIEFFGGIAKLSLVLGTIILMFVINGGVNPDGIKIGTRYFIDGVTHNSEVAGAPFQAVFEAIPLATFAYIGVELLTTTAFEALDPDELRLPAANVGWVSTVLYTLATGCFVANISWQDQNLPQLFQQALTVITDPAAASTLTKFQPPAPETHAAPLIALYRVGYRFLPSFLNGCFIYSGLSCANTALYVASRQLYGMTRTITVDYDSSVIRRGLAWMSSVHYKTKAPWPAIAISGLLLCWLPFIRYRTGNDKYLQDVQGALIAIGSVSCILMWCSQCVAYIMFFHWREFHLADLEGLKPKWNKLFEKRNGGYFKDFQPFFGYLGAVSTLLIVFFFNTVSLWNGKRISVKAISAFVSPAIVLIIWIVKKISRRDDGRFKFFLNLSNFRQFERRLQALEDLIYPGEGPDPAQVNYDLNMRPLHEQHTRLFPNERNNTLENLQRPFTPDHDSNGNRPPSFNRTNLTLTTSQNNIRQDYVTLGADRDPESPEQDPDIERDAMPYYRADPVPLPTPPLGNREFLSPSSASSRRWLRDIHEADGEMEARSTTGSNGSGGQLM